MWESRWISRWRGACSYDKCIRGVQNSITSSNSSPLTVLLSKSYSYPRLRTTSLFPALVSSLCPRTGVLHGTRHDHSLCTTSDHSLSIISSLPVHSLPQRFILSLDLWCIIVLYPCSRCFLSRLGLLLPPGIRPLLVLRAITLQISAAAHTRT